MVRFIILIFAFLEQPAEFQGLVGLVVVHGPEAQARDPDEKRRCQNDQQKSAESGLVHFAGVP
jgi:hypothetical protein